MLSAPQRHLTLLAFFLVSPVLALASSIGVNGTCDAGICPAPGTALAPGSSIPITAFNFDTTVNGDLFDVAGEYSASNTTSSPTGFTTTQFVVTATYEGSGPSSADILTIDDLQDFTVPGSFSLSGTYDEDTAAGFGVGLAPSSSVSYEAFYNGQGVGLLGPVTSPDLLSTSNALTISGTSLDVDSRVTFDFAAGSTPGSLLTTTPEPGGVIPIAAILALGLGIPAIRRFGRFSKNIG